MTKHLIIVLAIFMLSCQNSQSELIEVKVLEVTKFKSEMTELKDSVEFYFDKILAIKNIDGHPDTVPIILKQKVKYLEAEINTKIVSFPKVAKEIGLSQEEYDKVILDIDSLFTSMTLKYSKIKEMGYEIE